MRAVKQLKKTFKWPENITSPEQTLHEGNDKSANNRAMNNNGNLLAKHLDDKLENTHVSYPAEVFDWDHRR